MDGVHLKKKIVYPGTKTNKLKNVAKKKDCKSQLDDELEALMNAPSCGTTAIDDPGIISCFFVSFPFSFTRGPQEEGEGKKFGLP